MFSSLSAWSIFCLLTAILIKSAHSSRILAIFPIPFKEHQSVYRPLIENLLKNGHEITLLTTNPYFTTDRQYEFENITEIDLSFVYNLEILNDLQNGDLEGSEMLKTVFNVMRKVSEAELNSPKVKELLDKAQEGVFDAVLVEWSGSASLMNIFAHKYKTPLIAITNGEAFPNVHEALGNVNHPISFPSVFLPFSENLNIMQRISSVLFTIWYRFYYYTEEIPLQNEIIRNVLGGGDVPDLWQIESNADLLLINSYEALGTVRPTNPTTIYLGGIHQKNEVLAQDLKQFLDESSRVVYVNLNFGNHYFPSRLTKLLQTLKQLNVDVVWNNNGEMINTSSRIFQGSDLQQEAILSHKNVILHVSDGGQRNIEDTIHHAVPVLGISYISSVDHYLHKMEEFDCGINSYIDYDSKEELVEKFETIINIAKYKKNIKKLSNVLKDQPLSDSVDRATWYIEHVIRNEGTNYLRHSIKSLSWLQYLMIDVLVGIIFSSAVIICALIYAFNKMKEYSKSLPFEKVTRGSKCKVL